MNVTEAQFAQIQRRMGKRVKHANALPVPSEAAEQEAVMAWAKVAKVQYPELSLLAHIPNGGLRDKATAAALARAGVSAGIPDLILACQRRGPDGEHYGALFVEMKKRDRSNGPSAAQEQWIDALRREGYFVVVAYGSDAAIDAIEQYLQLQG